MSKASEHYIAGFGPKEWTGKPLKDSGSLFMGSGFVTFLLCLFFMMIIPPLRDVAVVIILCTLVAIIVMCASIASNVRRDKACMQRMTEQVNTFILEATGDPTARINLARMQTLVADRRHRVKLSINGVPGVEVGVRAMPEQMTHITALLMAPDYGLESFDVLLDAESKRKP
jgi:hypothetical protein